MPRLTRDGYRHWLGRRNGVCLGQPQAVRTGKKNATFTDSNNSVMTDQSSGQTLEATTINPSQDGGLTHEQKQAFKEVFDLFDVNGGGTIDVGELDASLRSVGINVDQSVLVDVVHSLDENGNDEIDFDEFLEMMTDNVTEIMGSSESEPAPKNNRGVFFAALRQFMDWSTLSNMDEIEKFYQAKTKPKQPHVVSHYAAGARLIGLTDKQLIKHLKTLKAMHAKNGEKSPYAQPLLNLCDKTDEKVVYDKTQKMSIKKQTVASVATSNETLPRIPASQSPSNHGSGDVATTTGASDKTPPIGGAREKELTFEEGACQTLALRIQALHEKKSVLQRNPFLCKKECKDRGWVSHRSRFVAVKLPGLARYNEGKPKLSAGNVAAIRAEVDAAKDTYYRQISRIKAEQSIAHWNHLVPQSIQTNTLRRRFRRVFCDYTALNDSQLPPLCAH